MGEKNNPNQNLDTRTMEQLTDEERRTQKKKKRETAKAGQEEDSHTCCGCRFPLLVALLQLGLGIAITALAFIMTASSSSFLVRDTPHWAGIFVCVVAVLGLCMFCMTYQADETTCCKFALKLAYFLLSALSLTVCMLAIAFSAYHYSLLTQMTCEMADDSSCQCKLNALDPLSRSFMYQDVSDCGTVTGTIKLYVLVQIILNILLGLVCLVACFIMWRDRYQVFYVGVRMRTLTTSEERQKV